MTTVTWSITNMVIIPQVDGYSDFAWQVGWSCTASDGVNTQMMGSAITFSPEQQGAPYTPYDQLTEAQVVQWVKEALGAETVAKTESVLINSLTATPAPLPWA